MPGRVPGGFVPGVFPADSCPDDLGCQFQEQEEWWPEADRSRDIQDDYRWTAGDNLEAEGDSRDTRDDNPEAEAGSRDIPDGIHRNSHHASSCSQRKYCGCRSRCDCASSCPSSSIPTRSSLR